MLKVFKKSSKSKKSEDDQLTEETMLPKIASQLESQKKGFSVSHSGRYKAKYKQRTAISDGLYQSGAGDKQTARPTDKHPTLESKQGTSAGQGAKGAGSTSSRSSSGQNSTNNSLNNNLKSSRPRISDLQKTDLDKSPDTAAASLSTDTFQGTSL